MGTLPFGELASPRASAIESARCEDGDLSLWVRYVWDAEVASIEKAVAVVAPRLVFSSPV